MRYRISDLSDEEVLTATHPDYRKGLPDKLCAQIDHVVSDLNPYPVTAGEVYRPWETAMSIRLILELGEVEELQWVT